jgi:hypothetical protein
MAKRSPAIGCPPYAVDQRQAWRDSILAKLDRTLGRRSVRWMISMAETRLPLYDPEPSIRARPEMFGEIHIFIRP